MNKRELINDIKEHLELDDFKPIGVGAGVMSLVRENDLVKEEVIISYKVYPGVYILRSSVTGRKTFKIVDIILRKYYLNNKINYGSDTIHHNSCRDEQILEVGISSSKDLEKILPSLKSMIVDDVLLFFSEYDSLEKVHHRVTELEISDLANFITNPPHPRVMIIKRLVYAQDWESYCEEVIEIYREQSEGKYKHVFAPIYAFLPELYEELKKLEI